MIIKNIEKDTYPVSIHIRRGDYVNIGWCVSPQYYEKAIDIMLEKHPDATFYVFSDDIKYAKELFANKKIPLYFANHTHKVKSFEDMWAMSKCKGNIIVNSSYSWWGAYLNNSPDKTVIVPSKIRHTNNNDAICQGWIEVDTTE